MMGINAAQLIVKAKALCVVHDQLFDGRPLRLLTMVDQLSREGPLIEVDFSISGPKVAEALDLWRSDGSRPI